MKVNLFLADATRQVEEQLAKLVQDAENPLIAAARYCLLNPGKRLRPLLMLATLASYEVPLEVGLIPACALEMIHTYSMIHDDLPCMDDDDLRRGKPTLHKVVPEWHALLTGDYLLTYAFELLATMPTLDAAQQITLMQVFAKQAGGNGMIGGQMIDLLSEQKQISWPLLEEMHKKKTASLIIIALTCGGILSRAPQQDLKALHTLGEKIGVAYQLIDDLLDTLGTVEEFGKPIGSDAKHQKATAVSILGIEQSQEKIRQLSIEIEQLFSTLSCPSTHLLQTLWQQMIQRSHKKLP